MCTHWKIDQFVGLLVPATRILMQNTGTLVLKQDSGTCPLVCADRKRIEQADTRETQKKKTERKEERDGKRIKKSSCNRCCSSSTVLEKRIILPLNRQRNAARYQ